MEPDMYIRWPTSQQTFLIPTSSTGISIKNVGSYGVKVVINKKWSLPDSHIKNGGRSPGLLYNIYKQILWETRNCTKVFHRQRWSVLVRSLQEADDADDALRRCLGPLLLASFTMATSKKLPPTTAPTDQTYSRDAVRSKPELTWLAMEVAKFQKLNNLDWSEAGSFGRFWDFYKRHHQQTVNAVPSCALSFLLCHGFSLYNLFFDRRFESIRQFHVNLRFQHSDSIAARSCSSSQMNWKFRTRSH